MYPSYVKEIVDVLRDLLIQEMPKKKEQERVIINTLLYKFIDIIDTKKEDKIFSNEYSKYSWLEIFAIRDDEKAVSEKFLRGMYALIYNEELPDFVRKIFKTNYGHCINYKNLGKFLIKFDSLNIYSVAKVNNIFKYLMDNMDISDSNYRESDNIYDLMIKILAPKVSESVLDPICVEGDLLARIAKKASKVVKENNVSYHEGRICGYSLNPKLYLISLLNTYFKQCNNIEMNLYNIFSEVEKWNENFDVILSNPAFKYAKGKVNKEKLFDTKSTRPEILFLEYVMKHLSIDGRAAVIVSDNFLTQLSGSYKESRRKLVEDKYLYAVVALPRRISSDSNSINNSLLLIDRKIAASKESIFFTSLRSDGYIQKEDGKINEVSNANNIFLTINAFKRNEKINLDDTEFIIAKDSIRKYDYILDKQVLELVESERCKHKIVKLRDDKIFLIDEKAAEVDEKIKGDDIPYVTELDLLPSRRVREIDETCLTSKLAKGKSDRIVPEGTILIALDNYLGKILITKKRMLISKDFKSIVVKNNELFNNKYVAYMLSGRINFFENNFGKGNVAMFCKEAIYDYQIPIIPMERQKDIVEDLEERDMKIARLKDELSKEEKEIDIKFNDLREMNNL